MHISHSWLSRSIMLIWVVNCILATTIAIKQVWIPYMDAKNDSYTSIVSDPFDGTSIPIAYIPDWTKIANQDKSRKFEDIAISEYIPIPLYDALSLVDTKSTTQASTILHYTYITPYMGNYKLDYKENVGGHLGVDIRAPIGTPVLAIANSVVVRTVESDIVGNKYIVLRHDNVPQNGEKKSLYSGYLHLSEISVKEGSRIKKWDMIGRVGMTGISTTPHLHLQIDTEDAPFHPYWAFTTGEYRAAGVGFYDAVNIWLWQEKARMYTIHPMNFINTYLWWVGIETSRIDLSALAKQSTPAVSVRSTAPVRDTIVASYISEDTCEEKRFTDIWEKTSFGKLLYPIWDQKCMFREWGNTLEPKTLVNYKEALMNIMKYYDIPPTKGTSHFLDIEIGDIFQWYAQSAYRRGILDGNYAYPDKLLTRQEFVKLLIKVSGALKNPSEIQIYADVNRMNLDYESIQNYALLVRARGGKFYPNTLMNRWMMVQMFALIEQKK